MDKRLVKLSRDPFCIDVGKDGGWYFIEPRTGDVKFGSAVMRASKGLKFSLIPEPNGPLLRLQYADITIEIGLTDDAREAMKWVEAVNQFLETKREKVPANGKSTTPAAVGSIVK